MHVSRRRTVLFALGTIVALGVIGAGSFAGPYALRVRGFAAEPQRGFHAPFYLYVSPGARRLAAAGTPVTILVQPNNSGRTSDDVSVHERDAWWTGLERQRIADELQVALLVPAFIRPATDWTVYTHALDRDVFTTKRPELARPDLQLIAMIDRARAALAQDGMSSDDRILIQGFSASGMFANRFTLLHPERVKAATIGSPGGWPVSPLPSASLEQLPYPAGTADLAQLAGRPFDVETFKSVPQLFVMGSLDDNDSVDFEDGWEKPAAAQVERLFGATPVARWPKAAAMYEAAGSKAKFVLVDGVGHDRKALQGRSTAFFHEVLGR